MAEAPISQRHQSPPAPRATGECDGDAAGLAGCESGRALGRDADGRMAHGLPAVACDASVARRAVPPRLGRAGEPGIQGAAGATPSFGLSTDLSEKRARIIRTARARNRMLLWLEYRERVPYCELEGEAAPRARRTYLASVPCAFSKSDRSMVIWDPKRRAWGLIVDDSWHPQLYATKYAALEAGRVAEKQADEHANSAATREGERRTAWLRSPDVQAWARRRDREYAADALACRIAGRDF